VSTLESDIVAPALLPERFLRWFAARGWSPRDHQLALLAKARDDRSALLIAPTGAGKTLAGFLPTLVELSCLFQPLPGGGLWWAGARSAQAG
jgi:ATP-dependent Lhr-like helicase